MQTLPLALVVQEALSLVWLKRVRLAEALVAYILIFVVLGTGFTQLLEGSGWGVNVIFMVILLAVLTLFAVSCHRIILLDDCEVPRFGIFSWSSRETRFLGWTLAAYAILGALMLMFSAIAMAITSLSNENFGWLNILALLPGAYVFSRLSLLLPATALDKRHDMKWAWDTTENNGWRMTVLVAIIPTLTTYLGSKLASGHALLEVVHTLLSFLIMAVEITLLSVSFRYLSTASAEIIE